MNIYQDIPSPAQGIAAQNASLFGLQNHGLTNLHRVYWNLTSAPLYEEAVFRGEGSIAHLGPFIVNTGKHTARAAADKFIVREQTTEDRVWWGQYNRPFSPEKFSALLTRMQGYLQSRDVFVQDLYEPQESHVTSSRQRVTARSRQRLYPDPAAVIMTA